MKRSKRLTLPSWDFFKAWYLYMKTSFSNLTLKYIRFTSGSHNVTVVISY
jgi:hypothetical protein